MSETDCQEILKQVEIFLDGELDESACVQIREHLRLCDGCTDKAEFQRSLKVLVSKKCRCEDLPEGLMNKVISRIDGSPPPSVTP